jgi:hypothetical protein
LTSILGRWTSRSKPGSLAAQNVEIAPFAVLASRVRGTTRVWPGAPLKSVDVQRGVRWTSECAVSRTEESFTSSGHHHGSFLEITNTECSETSLASTEQMHPQGSVRVSHTVLSQQGGSGRTMVAVRFYPLYMCRDLQRVTSQVNSCNGIIWNPKLSVRA